MAEATIAINIKGNTADINAALERLSSQLKRTATQSDQTGKRIRGLSTSMKAIKRNLTGLTAGFFSAYGAVRLFGTTTDILAQFEHEMMRVKVTSGATQSQFADLTTAAAKLGKTTVFTQTEVAQGMRFLAMSGMEVQEILDSQEAVLNLAQIGMIGLGRASDIATNIMQAFGINAHYMTDVVDDLTTTISSSNTNMTQLGDAIKYVGPVASGAGIPLRDVAAAVGTLSNAGLQGSMAGTGLRMVLMRLQSPTKETADALARIGLTTEEVNPAIHGMDTVLERLSNSFGVAGEASKIFGIRQAAAGTVLVEGIKDFRELNTELKNNQGAAQEAADELKTTLFSAFKLVKSAFTGLVQALGDAGLTDALKNMSSQIKAFATGLTKTVAGMGDLTGVFNMILASIGAMIAAATVFVGIWGAKVFGKVMMAAWAVSKPFFIGFIKLCGLARTATLGLAIAIKGLTLSLRTLMASTVVLAVLVGIGFAIEALIKKVSDGGADIKEAYSELQADAQKENEKISAEIEKAIKESNTPDQVKKGGEGAVTSVLTAQMKELEDIDDIRADLIQATAQQLALEKITNELFGQKKKDHMVMVDFARERVRLLTEQIEAENKEDTTLAGLIEKKVEILDLEEQITRNTRTREALDRSTGKLSEQEASVKEKEQLNLKTLEAQKLSLAEKYRKEQEKILKTQIEQADAAKRGMDDNKRDFEVLKLKSLSEEKDKFGRKTGRAKEATKALNALEDEKAVDSIVRQFEKSLKGMATGEMDGPANEFLIEKRRQEAMAVVAQDRANKDRQTIGLGLGGVSSLAKIGGGGGVAGDLELQANALRERAAIAAEKQLEQMNAMNQMQQGILEALRGNGDSPTFGLTRS